MDKEYQHMSALLTYIWRRHLWRLCFHRNSGRILSKLALTLTEASVSCPEIGKGPF